MSTMFEGMGGCGRPRRWRSERYVYEQCSVECVGELGLRLQMDLLKTLKL